jgi:hypothetical protein
LTTATLEIDNDKNRDNDGRNRAFQHTGAGGVEVTSEDQSSSGLVPVAQELRVLWADRAAAAKLGVSSREIEGRHCNRIWNNRETPGAVCPVQVSFVSSRPEAREVVDHVGNVWDLWTAPILAPGARLPASSNWLATSTSTGASRPTGPLDAPRPTGTPRPLHDRL